MNGLGRASAAPDEPGRAAVKWGAGEDVWRAGVGCGARGGNVSRSDWPKRTDGGAKWRRAAGEALIPRRRKMAAVRRRLGVGEGLGIPKIGRRGLYKG